MVEAYSYTAHVALLLVFRLLTSTSMFRQVAGVLLSRSRQGPARDGPVQRRIGGESWSFGSHGKVACGSVRRLWRVGDSGIEFVREDGGKWTGNARASGRMVVSWKAQRMKAVAWIIVMSMVEFVRRTVR